MSKRTNPETSLSAYRSLDPSQLSETYRKILWALGQIGEGSYEDISSALKCKPDKVWKRLPEMTLMGLIYRPGNKRRLSSGREGYTYKLVKPGDDLKTVTEKHPTGYGVSHYAKKIQEITQKTLF